MCVCVCTKVPFWATMGRTQQGAPSPASETPKLDAPTPQRNRSGPNPATNHTDRPGYARPPPSNARTLPAPKVKATPKVPLTTLPPSSRERPPSRWKVQNKTKESDDEMTNLRTARCSQRLKCAQHSHQFSLPLSLRHINCILNISQQ